MADSKSHRSAEVWIRENWLPLALGQPFTKRRLDLISGGQFEFDGVSKDRTIAVCVSTNGGIRATGGKASTKLHKIRSDVMFLLLANVERRIVVLADKAMHDLCMVEFNNGRLPQNVEFHLAEVPDVMLVDLAAARAIAAAEVTPVAPIS
jgi:hypothetical protein